MLWSGGISFAGVIAFIFADLIVLPIIAIYRKYYGTAFALRITTLMLTTMVAAALAVNALFSLAGIIPTTRPTTADVFTSIHLDYKLALNILGLGVFVALFALTVRRGVKDPICGMTVDRSKALNATRAGQTYSFCSEGCRTSFLASPANSHHD